MNEPYREWWMHSVNLRSLNEQIQQVINISIRDKLPLWEVLPKTTGLLSGLIPYVEDLEKFYWNSDGA